MSKTLVKRAYRYRFYPTEGQAAQLSRTFGCVRVVYNQALEVRTTAWEQEQRRITYVEASAMLTGWKATKEFGFLNEVSCVPLQQSLRHQQTAFANFFAKRARYPRFKSRKRGKASAEYTRSAFRWRGGQLTLAKMNQSLDIRWSRPLPADAQPSTVTVSRDPAGRWHVSILVETSVEQLPASRGAIGIDVGLTSLVTLSTGEKIANPRYEKRDRVRLARAQRALARNRSLARAISDAAWSAFRSMLEYKASSYGRRVVAVDRWLPTSKTCSACGQLKEILSLRIRIFECVVCGLVRDRDHNAALNILAAGRAVAACGDGVGPS